MSALPPPPLPALLAIALLLLLPTRAPRTLSHPSLFSARPCPRTYVSPRRFAPYPFGRVCSSPARAHFASRLSRPTRPLAPRAPPRAADARGRVLLSAVPVQVGDGLGHRACILNFEARLAQALGVAYAHRRESTYGSLTAADPLAVERLFNWGDAEIARQDVLKAGCADVAFVNDSCEIPAQNVVCRRLRSRASGGAFDQSVIIPPPVAGCFLRRHADVDRECAPLVRAFVAAYPEPNTLFQLAPDRCFREWLYTNFSSTGDWLRAKYWRGAVAVRLDASRVQLALHVRRGDFFNYTNRVLVTDDTFADVLWRVKHALDEIVGADLPLDAHVYSEGLARARVKDVHDTHAMDPVYVDHAGRVRGAGHWDRVVRGHRRAARRDVRVVTHFAEDTLRSVREMIAADVFVGSVSGLSTQVVRVFGRGVMVLPVWEGEVGEELVVPFDWGRNGFDSFLDEEALYAALAEVVRRNRLACAAW